MGANRDPDWSPDGQSLVYLAQRGPAFIGAIDSARLTIRSLASGNERDLSPKLGIVKGPRWSSDSHNILVTGSDEKGRGGIYRIDSETGATVPIVQQPGGYVLQAEWVPDGRTIVYHVTLAGGSRVVRQSLDGGHEQALLRADPTAAVGSLAVSPDGQHLAFRAVDASGVVAIRMLSLDGGQPRDLLSLGKGDNVPRARGLAWMPDGRSLLFLRRPSPGTSSTKTELWRVSLDTGHAESLGFAMEGLRDITVRADGRSLAMTAGEYKAEIWMMENFLPPPPAPTVASRRPGAKR